MTDPDLVLFTAGYPYDGSESVLGPELEVLAHRFPRVLVVPSRSGSSAAPLPAGVSVVDLGWNGNWERAEKLSVLRSRRASRVMGRTLRSPTNWRAYARGARSYLDILAANLLKAATLERWIAANGLHHALFYDYWFENTTLALAMLRQDRVMTCAIARAHGFDVFDSRWPDLGRVPFREFKAKHLDAIFAISEDGAGYLRRALGNDATKVRTARLGVPLPASYPAAHPSSAVVVSCSSLVPVKRVHLIPEVLSNSDRPLHWVHFGDGPERARVRTAAARLPDRVTWELRGWVENACVRDFYGAEPVSAFLSVSESEGIPVSMMEAQSFGIPIVALSVGGVPELVTEETGILRSQDAEATEIATALRAALEPNRFDRERIRSIFAASYESNANYVAFADQLLSIWSRSPHGG